MGYTIDLGRVVGKDGAKGDTGDAGATFTPHLDAAGNLSWTNDKGLPNPETVNVAEPAAAKLTPKFSEYLPLKGGAMSGDLKLGSNRLHIGSTTARELNRAEIQLEGEQRENITIHGVAAPVEDFDAANKQYVDNASKPVVIAGTLDADQSTITVTTPNAFQLVAEAWSDAKHPLVAFRIDDEAYAYLSAFSADPAMAIFSIPATKLLDAVPPRTIILDGGNTAMMLEALDSQMSDTSTAAVQNKVVKKYVDDTAAGLQTALGGKQPAGDYALRSELFGGSYNDLTDRPAIPEAVTEQTVVGWGFTKNTGTYSKPNSGIPRADLAAGVQTSLGKADTALQSHQSLAGYATESWVMEKGYQTADQVQAAIDGDTKVIANTAARHIHDNKTVLDGITAEKLAAWDYVAANAGGGGSKEIEILTGMYDPDGDDVVTLDAVPEGATPCELIKSILDTGKWPVLKMTNPAGDWDAYFTLCRFDDTNGTYQFSSYELADETPQERLQIIDFYPAYADGHYEYFVPASLQALNEIDRTVIFDITLDYRTAGTEIAYNGSLNWASLVEAINNRKSVIVYAVEPSAAGDYGSTYFMKIDNAYFENGAYTSVNLVSQQGNWIEDTLTYRELICKPSGVVYNLTDV